MRLKLGSDVITNLSDRVIGCHGSGTTSGKKEGKKEGKREGKREGREDDAGTISREGRKTTTRGSKGKVLRRVSRYGRIHARKAAGKDAAGTVSSSSTPGPRDHGTGTGGRPEDDAGRPEGRPEGCRDRHSVVKCRLYAALEGRKTPPGDRIRPGPGKAGGILSEMAGELRGRTHTLHLIPHTRSIFCFCCLAFCSHPPSLFCFFAFHVLIFHFCASFSSSHIFQ